MATTTTAEPPTTLRSPSAGSETGATDTFELAYRSPDSGDPTESGSQSGGGSPSLANTGTESHVGGSTTSSRVDGQRTTFDARAGSASESDRSSADRHEGHTGAGRDQSPPVGGRSYQEFVFRDHGDDGSSGEDEDEGTHSGTVPEREPDPAPKRSAEDSLESVTIELPKGPDTMSMSSEVNRIVKKLYRELERKRRIERERKGL